MPETDIIFYPSILGAVLLGIGIALLIERFRPFGLAGLGLGGAIAINLCGAGGLAVWLVSGRLGIPLRGAVLHWGLFVVLVGISLVEGLDHLRQKPGRRA